MSGLQAVCLNCNFLSHGCTSPLLPSTFASSKAEDVFIITQALHSTTRQEALLGISEVLGTCSFLLKPCSVPRPSRL